MRTIALVTCLAGLVGCSAMGGGSSPHPLPPGLVLATIPVGTPPTLLAITPDGSRVVAQSSGQLSIINASTNTVAGTAKIPPYPTGIAVTPDGQRALMDTVSSARLTVADLA